MVAEVAAASTTDEATTTCGAIITMAGAEAATTMEVVVEGGTTLVAVVITVTKVAMGDSKTFLHRSLILGLRHRVAQTSCLHLLPAGFRLRSSRQAFKVTAAMHHRLPSAQLGWAVRRHRSMADLLECRVETTAP